MVRIRDVAKKLNLSITTVSRALDGYDDVAERTRQLVIRAAQEMGYTPNRAARQLRRKHAETIGYIMPSPKPVFSDAFLSEFVSGLGDEAALHNYDMLIAVAKPDSSEERAAYQRWVQSGKVDGLVLNRIRLNDWRVQYLTEQKIPFVCLERSMDPFEFFGVEMDSYSAFLDLTNYLVGLGHRRIAYIGGGVDLKIEHDRSAGYLAGLTAAGIPISPELIVQGDLTAEGGYRAADQLLTLVNAPTAIMCINDPTAIGAIHAAHDLGLYVGNDVAISGFDGVADAAHMLPPLTTVEQTVYSVARLLAKILFAQLVGCEFSEKQIKMRPRLIIRSSTGGKRIS